MHYKLDFQFVKMTEALSNLCDAHYDSTLLDKCPEESTRVGYVEKLIQ